MYNREDDLRGRLNSSLIRILSLPTKDYIAKLSVNQLVELKSVLSNINNAITLNLTLALAKWISQWFQLSKQDTEEIRMSIIGNKPNENGYDVDLKSPINVIAEVKCNIPINNGSKYGSNQRVGIKKDLKGLKFGKKKAPKRNNALKFMALFDHKGIREATAALIKTLEPELRDSVEIIEEVDSATMDKDKIYIVYLDLE